MVSKLALQLLIFVSKITSEVVFWPLHATWSEWPVHILVHFTAITIALPLTPVSKENLYTCPI